MKHALKLALLAIIMSLPSSGKAFTYAFQDYGGISYGGSLVTGNVEFSLGYFSGSITVNGPTIDLTNYTNLNTDGDGGVWWNPAYDFGDPAAGNPADTFISVGTDPMDSNIGGLKPAANTLLYVVGRSTTGPSFSFAFGNSAWMVKTNTPTDLGGAIYAWGEGFTFANATVFTSNASLSTSSGNIITVVPEPSTGALLMIGSVGLVALRRLRKV